MCGPLSKAGRPARRPPPLRRSTADLVMDPGQKVRKPLYREPGHDKQTTVDSVWRVESSFFGHKVSEWPFGL